MAHEGPIGSLAITQIAVVSHDLRKLMETYHKNLGWGPWSVFVQEPPLLHDTVLRGKPTAFTFMHAETHVGPVDFEIIQPLEGPSIYKEWLDQHGEGVHHIACMKVGSNPEELLKQFGEMGMQELMAGSIGDTIRFFYLDTQPMLKFILESGSGHAIDLKPTYVYPS
ncbi:MAG TPA: VOC family protein [Chloroflexota bacterium]|nr:VOC family protein [Chloroflexota bacterium]